MEVKHWQQPADTIKKIFVENDERRPIQIFTDRSKSEGVGVGIAMFESGHHIKSLQWKLNKRCTNNQTEI